MKLMYNHEFQFSDFHADDVGNDGDDDDDDGDDDDDDDDDDGCVAVAGSIMMMGQGGEVGWKSPKMAVRSH